MGPMSHCSVLQAQPTEPAVVIGTGWLQAQPPVLPTRLSLSPFLSVSLPSWGCAFCSSLPLLHPFQTEPLNLSPFATLVYTWLINGEPQEDRGSATSLRHPSTFIPGPVLGARSIDVDKTQSVFAKLTAYTLCTVNKPRPGPAAESVCLPVLRGAGVSYGLWLEVSLSTGGVHVPASRSNQLLGLTGGLAGGWGWADSGQQKGREGAGGSDSVGRL